MLSSQDKTAIAFGHKRAAMLSMEMSIMESQLYYEDVKKLEFIRSQILELIKRIEASNDTNKVQNIVKNLSFLSRLPFPAICCQPYSSVYKNYNFLNELPAEGNDSFTYTLPFIFKSNLSTDNNSFSYKFPFKLS